MAPTGFSTLAHQLEGRLHEYSDRTAPVFGVAVHQTGEDMVARALEEGVDPLEFLAAYYLKPDSYCAHYVMGWNGDIIQICGESEHAEHIGYPPDQHLALRTRAWESKVSQTTRDLWHARWPHFTSPAMLFPGPSPNNVYVGIEMLPIVDGANVKPASFCPAAKFTEEQHHACAELSHDIAVRQRLPTGWQLGNRFLGHEDVNPLSRSSVSGGWDPGSLRAQPWFDMEWTRTYITANYAPRIA
jgi:N-acetyl-anhydromuramyl-L-alanine amidase AmpD